MTTVPNEPTEVRADQIEPGAILPLAIGGGRNLAEIVACTPYADSDGGHMAALTAIPLGGGEPTIVRFRAGAKLELSTQAEIAEHRAAEEHREFVAGLRSLADFFEANPIMPRPLYPDFLHCVHASDDDAGRAEVALIATLLGGPPRDDCHAERQFGPIRYRAFYNLRSEMEQHNADVALLRSVKSSTEDTSASVAGAVGDAAPSGPEVPASGPDNPVEHYQAGGSVGGYGQNSAHCACGVEFNGFDTHAEARAALDQHIADATAPTLPMADCTEPATQRIEVYRPTVGHLDGSGRVGAVYPCNAHRGEAMATLLAAGMRGRTAGTVSGEPCGYEVNYITGGAPLLAAPTKTAAEGTGGDATSADATATDPVTRVNGSPSGPVRADAVPAAPASPGGAAGITPDRPGYDANPTILARTPEEAREAYARYATSLDSWAPGWHWDDTDRMAHELAAEAKARRAADTAERPYRCEGCGKTSRIAKHDPGCPVDAAFDARLAQNGSGQ